MVDLNKLKEKFFTDPDWRMMEELIRDYLEPFRSVEEIPNNLSNDQIATEVRGRKLMIARLEQFLSDTGILSRPKAAKQVTFK